MKIDQKSVWADIQAIKKTSPLVHNITNYVAMESSANGLLAIGASPIMAQAVDEVEDIVKIANSLVLNIGTLSSAWIQAMILALKAANSKEIPVILDPVGTGATPYRTNTAFSLLAQGKISAIRGNASEITSLAGNHVQVKGVDSLLNAINCQDQATQLASNRKCVVWMSGATDVISDGNLSILVYNGHPLMSRVTGMGCMATAITGAFLASNQNILLGCAHSSITMGIAGEIAAKNSKGPGSFKMKFIDTLYNLSLNQIEEHIRFDIL